MPVNSTSSSTTCWRVNGQAAAADHRRGRAGRKSSPISRPPFRPSSAPCALNAQVEGIVAGEERLSFAELDLWSEQLAHALASRGIRKGDCGHRYANCPSWVVSYMAIAKAGRLRPC